MATHVINPAMVVQSTVALTVAIVVTDAIRDTISILKPHTARGAVLARIAAAVIIIILTIILIRHFSVCSAAGNADKLIVPTSGSALTSGPALTSGSALTNEPALTSGPALTNQ